MNEPADESRAVVGPFYDRLSAAIREIDPEHILFFDGNTYSTEFGFFGEPLENAVYTLHDYVPAGPRPRRRVPGARVGRGEVPRALGVRAPHGHADLRRRVRPDLHGRRGGRRASAAGSSTTSSQLYKRYGAGFATWMYKDLGRQGLTSSGPTRPTASWSPTSSPRSGGSGSTSGGAPAARTRRSPSRSRIWSRARRRTSIPTRGAVRLRADAGAQHHARPAAGREYAELFRGLGEDELIALADSFAFENCVVRETPARPAREQLSASAPRRRSAIIGSGLAVARSSCRLARMAPDRAAGDRRREPAAERGATSRADGASPPSGSVGRSCSPPSGPTSSIVSVPVGRRRRTRSARARRARRARCSSRRRRRPTSPACARCGPTWARSGLVQVAEQYLLMPAPRGAAGRRPRRRDRRRRPPCRSPRRTSTTRSR